MQKITIGIDQMNVVATPFMETIVEKGWSHNAENLITGIESVLNMNVLYGESRKTDKKLVQGYTVGKAYGEDTQEIRICYHPDCPDMGVVVNFTAQALARYKELYKEEFDEEIYEYDMIKTLDMLGHTIRLSRIDFYADYVNENISVNSIYRQLEKGNQVIKYLDGRLNNSSRSYHGEEGSIDTLYVGKRGRNMRCLLRMYDKKKEQIKNVGRSYKEATECESWVRAEVEFHKKYANDLTEALRNVDSPEGLGKLIAKSIIEKYGFYSAKSGKPNKATKLLMEAAKDSKFKFSLPSTRDIKLERSHLYVRCGSGAVKNAYMAKEIWGEEAIPALQEQFRQDVENYKPTSEVIYWLKKHKTEYERRDIKDVFGFYDISEEEKGA